MMVVILTSLKHWHILYPLDPPWKFQEFKHVGISWILVPPQCSFQLVNDVQWIQWIQCPSRCQQHPAACLLSGLHHLPKIEPSIWYFRSELRSSPPKKSQVPVGILTPSLPNTYGYSDMDIAVQNCTPSGPAVPILEAVLESLSWHHETELWNGCKPGASEILKVIHFDPFWSPKKSKQPVQPAAWWPVAAVFLAKPAQLFRSQCRTRPSNSLLCLGW